MILAEVWKLPVVLVCENNLCGEYTPFAQTSPVPHVADRAAAYDIPAEIVDGQDADEMFRAIRGAVRRARRGGGPSLIEAKTYRFVGHSRTDPATYRPPGELEKWRQRDPIQILASRLQMSESELKERADRTRAKEESALQWAMEQPEPPVESLREGIRRASEGAAGHPGRQGAGGGFAAQHSQCAETLFMHYAGLKVAAPETPADVLGLLKTAIRDDNPVIFLEHKMLYNLKGDVPDGEHLVPFGKARIAREGRDVTIVLSHKMLGPASDAAQRLDAEGISCEIIDPRMFAPLDLETIGRSLEKTGRLVTAEEAVRPCGWGAEIVSRMCEEGFCWLDAPVRRVTMGESIIPFSQSLEDALMPGVEDMIAAVHALP